MFPRLPRCILSTTCRCSRYSTSKPNANNCIFDTDELGLPKSPTWSVHDLLNSYPPVELSDATLIHLHNAAALIPPNNSGKFETMKRDMADIIKLVEAVRMAPLSSTSPSDSSETEKQSDGRIWPEERSIDLRDFTSYEAEKQSSSSPPEGRELLNKASRSWGGFYLVDAPQSKD